MKQLTKQQAINFHNSGIWQDMTLQQCFDFQFNQKLLCMPFDRFHEAAEHVLGRPVYTHEFAYPDQLRAEYYGEKEAPTLDDIINLIPAEKRILIFTDNSQN